MSTQTPTTTKQTPAKVSILHIRMTAAQMAELSKRAAADRRAVSDFARLIILDAIKA
jgi:hypothetical protein